MNTYKLKKRTLAVLVSSLAVVLIMLVLTPTLYAKWSTRALRYNANSADLQTVPQKPVALVFGAGLYDGDKPTLYLANRVRTAVDLYKAGRVGHLLMTGDNSRTAYDEPTAMRKYAIKLGMDPSKITLDYAGFSTYDSCYRAKKIFGITSATVVTQGYHLPRAVMTCSHLGIDTIGVAAKKQHQRDWKAMYVLREYASTDKAVGNIIFKPKPPILGKSEPINLTAD